MAWTDRATKSAGDIPTADEWNESIANENYLLTPNSDDDTVSGVADNTTTSTSWVAVDTTNWRRTITTNGGTVLVVAIFEARTSSNNITISFDFAIDGTRIGDATAGLISFNGKSGGSVQMMPVIGIATPSAGTHNIDLYWKMQTGTGTLYNNTDIGYMFVMEG